MTIRCARCRLIPSPAASVASRHLYLRIVAEGLLGLQPILSRPMPSVNDHDGFLSGPGASVMRALQIAEGVAVLGKDDEFLLVATSLGLGMGSGSRRGPAAGRAWSAKSARGKYLSRAGWKAGSIWCRTPSCLTVKCEALEGFQGLDFGFEFDDGTGGRGTGRVSSFSASSTSFSGASSRSSISSGSHSGIGSLKAA